MKTIEAKGKSSGTNRGPSFSFMSAFLILCDEFICGVSYLRRTSRANPAQNVAFEAQPRVKTCGVQLPHYRKQERRHSIRKKQGIYICVQNLQPIFLTEPSQICHVEAEQSTLFRAQQSKYGIGKVIAIGLRNEHIFPRNAPHLAHSHLLFFLAEVMKKHTASNQIKGFVFKWQLRNRGLNLIWIWIYSQHLR